MLARFVFCAALVVVLSVAGVSRAEETPRFVIYYNADVSPVTDMIGLPYTHVILSFVTARVNKTGEVELVVPDRLGPTLKQVPALQKDGKTVLMSFGGGDMLLRHYKPLVGREKELAKALAAFVKKHGLDGLDIDFEASEALHKTPPAHAFDGRAFLTTLTTELHDALEKDALITHVPQSPYFDPRWHGGPYLQVLEDAGDMIDWVTVQYYNNPGRNAPLIPHLPVPEDPWTYAGIVDDSDDFIWPPEKTVVGLPVYHADASSGYRPPARVLNDIVRPLIARHGEKFGGLAGWQFSTHTADHRFWNQKMIEGLKAAQKDASTQKTTAH